MIEETKIFILVPVYNVEKYIENCLNSVTIQKYKNYELILVDDGSRDKSGEICDKFHALYPENITVIHRENAGLLSARRCAVNFVRENRVYDGSYCIFLDSDDEIKDGTLETINKYLHDEKCDLLIYGYEVFDGDKIIRTSLSDYSERRVVTDKRELFTYAVIDKGMNAMWQKAVKTELLFDGDFESVMHVQMGEDLIQSVQIYRQCEKTVVVPDVFYRYRSNQAGITHGIKIKLYTDDLSSREYAVSVIKRYGIWTDDDFEKYRHICLDMFNNHIRRICGSCRNLRETVAFLKTIRSHPIIDGFYKDGIYSESSVRMKLFKHSRFKTLWLFEKINNVKKRLTGGR